MRRLREEREKAKKIQTRVVGKDVQRGARRGVGRGRGRGIGRADEEECVGVMHNPDNIPDNHNIMFGTHT